MTERGIKGDRSVIEGRAPEEVPEDDPVTRLYRALGFFPSDPWTGRLIAELIAEIDPWRRIPVIAPPRLAAGVAGFEGPPWRVLEPACGQGHLVLPLRETFGARVEASDIHAHDGLEALGGRVADFLTPDYAPEHPPDWVVTNPPFHLAAEFAQRALDIARRGVVLICRLTFEESAGREAIMACLGMKAVLVDRTGMTLGQWHPEKSTMTAYGLFVFLRPGLGQQTPLARAIREARAAGGYFTRRVEKGARARLTTRADVARFGPPAGAAPLLAGMEVGDA